MTDDDQNAGEGAEGQDFIYRGDDHPTDWDARTEATPPPATPGAQPPPAPPGAQPPPAPPGAAVPPPAPGAAPPPIQADGTPAAPRRKRWPWIVGALVLLCALPLGGCVALIAFGLSEIDERSDAIEGVTDDFMQAVVAGRADDSTALMDGGIGCLEPSVFVSSLETELAAADEWSVDDVTFVDRTDNGYLSNSSDPENFVYAGREDDGFAIVRGELLLDGTPQQDVRVLLLKPGDDWQVCTLELP